MISIPLEQRVSELRKGTIIARQAFEARAPFCLFSLEGRAEVRIGDRAFEVAPQRALWVPEGASCLMREHGPSTMLPVIQRAPTGSRMLSEAREIEVPEQSRGGILRAFERSLGHFSESKEAPDDIARALVDRYEPPVALTLRAAPPLPRSEPAREIARAVVERPALRRRLEHWAQQACISERTLQRRFLTETGRTFARWRRDARVAAGVRIIVSERSARGVFSRVGFGSHSSFSAACRDHLGATPQQIASLAAQDPPHGALRLPADRLPAAEWSSGARRNGISGLVWLARGEAGIELAGAQRRLAAGDVAWLPGGQTMRIDLARGAVLLPYLWVGGAEPPQRELRRLRDSSERERLRTVGERYAWPRVLGPRPETAWGWSSPRQRSSLSPAQRAVMSIREWVTRHPVDARGIAQWAVVHEVSAAELRATFRSMTGLTFPRWRASMRMVAARRLIEAGTAVDETAARVGYAHPSGFTRAFTAAYGVPPSAYSSETAEPPQAPEGRPAPPARDAE